ncbi:hypothetical protein GCM10010988_17510 [Cnuibacter physcomitrellae]|uniref:Uncharacterized protein n=1 Tax=Cnuibacter physcomitrellae TaxID=1619308 RepID=A0A1X9LWR7_9MICO|nr:hypothetical protein [Cnuibacter physcomitrellae]ARJ06490.1 hypothetical protein B5808_15655 [Cnuibacter physcomitrellae]GGI38141.1 hypothetical protein GCM10010988_17510 [Cnuibacter physcomitrellae]
MFYLARGIDEQSYIVLDADLRETAWRIECDRTGLWHIEHADSLGVSEILHDAGSFPNPEEAVSALARILGR